MPLIYFKTSPTLFLEIGTLWKGNGNFNIELNCIHSLLEFSLFLWSFCFYPFSMICVSFTFLTCVFSFLTFFFKYVKLFSLIALIVLFMQRFLTHWKRRMAVSCLQGQDWKDVPRDQLCQLWFGTSEPNHQGCCAPAGILPWENEKS